MDTKMATADKIKAIEESGLDIAWEGCHKIYIVRSIQQAAEMGGYGYDIYPASQIRDLISRSCSLVFVSEATLERGPWDIQQFDKGLWIEMGWPLGEDDEEGD